MKKLMKDRKSLINFGVFIVVALLATVFLLNEANKAIAEINSLAAIAAK